MPGAVSPEGTPGAPDAPEAPTHAAPRRLESSFSVEALLARPGPRARTAGLWPSALCAPAPVLPWPGPETWLPPACLGPALHQPGTSIPVLALRLAPFCGLRSLGVTGKGTRGARSGGDSSRGGKWRGTPRAQWEGVLWPLIWQWTQAAGLHSNPKLLRCAGRPRSEVCKVALGLSGTQPCYVPLAPPIPCLDDFAARDPCQSRLLPGLSEN